MNIGRLIYINTEAAKEETEYQNVENLQEHAVRKYHGGTATGYDEKRKSSSKWKEEDRIIREYLEGTHKGDWVMDCPVGTGRFIPLYEELEVLYRGLDVSEDMINEAKKKVTNERLCRYLGLLPEVDGNCGIQYGTGLKDKSVDVSMMIRMTRWLSPDDCVKALKELQRVTRKKIIFTVRVRNHKEARPYGLIASALDGWEITEDSSADGADYRVIMLEPKDR